MPVPAPQQEPRVRQWTIALTGVVILVLCMIVYVYNPPVLNSIILQSHDMLLKRYASEPQSGQVVFVDLDDESLQTIGQWPWERVRIAHMVDALREAGARVVTFDVAFSERDRLSPSVATGIWRDVLPDFDGLPEPRDDWPDFDVILADALARIPSVLGFYVYMVDEPAGIEDTGDFPVWRGNFVEYGRRPEGRERAWLAQGRDLKPPLDVLRERTSMGFINSVPDKDNILRRSPLLIAIGDNLLYPSLGLESICLAINASNIRIYYDDKGGVEGIRHIAVQDLVIPTDANGRLMVNYRRGQFPTIRAVDLLTGEFDPADVRDRIVIIGSSAVGLYDRYATPLDEEISGALIQTTIIDNILAGDILSEPRWMFFVSLAALFAGGLILTLIVLRMRAVLSLLGFVAILSAPLFISVYLLKNMQLVFIPTPLMMGWALTYAGIVVMKYWQQEVLARYDAKLRVMNRQLETEVAERTVAEKDALAARTVALQAAAAKSEFLANMSHEIRTPMNSIIGMSDLALRTDLTGQQFNYIAKVRYSAHALLRLINDILDFSKLEAGKLDVENVEFDLDAVLGDVVDLLEHKVAEKNIDLILDFPPDAPRAVIGDPLRLRQVLINLAANAIKFTEKGHVCLRVGPASHDKAPAAGRVDMLFEVLDTGIGLTDAQQASLFQAFQQADASTTRKYGGTGLGLAISKNLVELMGGKIAVSSQAGEGSNFHFQLPLSRQPADNEPVLDLPADVRGRLTLVAGHQERLVAAIARDCETLGLRVETLADPRELKHRLENAMDDDGPQMAIVDTTGEDAPALIEFLQSLNAVKQASLPVIVLRVPDPDRDPTEATGPESGSIHFLDKPVKSAELISALRIAWGYEPLAQSAMWQTADIPKIEKGRLKNARVLLVDDNPINREVATENMVIYGILVECAVNGREAIEKARAQPWNLILMDVQMPEVDGYEATQTIRKLEQAGRTPRSRTPILAMTANAMQEDQEKCRACGMDDYLSKPLDADVFLAKLLEYIPPEDIPLPGVSVPVSSPVPEAQKATPATDRVTADAKPAAEEIPEIEGVDVGAGLRRLQGNVQLYRRLLTDFAVNHADDAAVISREIADGNHEQARIMAHTIKGSAANLELTAIHRAAADIDQALRNNDPDTAVKTNADLEKALQQFRRSFGADTMMETAGKECLVQPLALASGGRETVVRLVDELRLGNIDGLQSLETVKSILGDAGATPDLLEAITQSAETFDFEMAADLLAGTMQRGAESESDMEES